MTASIKMAYSKMTPWCSDYHYCTTSFSKTWAQVLCTFESCSQRVEDLWQQYWLEIRLNSCRRSTTPQKQFIIIIHSFIKVTFKSICLVAFSRIFVPKLFNKLLSKYLLRNSFTVKFHSFSIFFWTSLERCLRSMKFIL